MADTINITHVSFDTIKSQYPRWNSYPLMDQLLKKGKRPQILHFDINIDTSGAAAAETTDPTNIVLNFAAPQQVYIRSSNAGDTSKKVDVIGQKADGSFGQFTLTSDGTDGTTAVDVGTWNFIMQPKKNDAWAGNCTIDDDGASTTVFWTLALGVDGTDGIIVIPDGYWGDVLGGYHTLLADPGAAGEGMLLQYGHVFASLTRNFAKDIVSNEAKAEVVPAQFRISLLNNYLAAAVTATFVHAMVVVWPQ
jgi:hypothetical protein